MKGSTITRREILTSSNGDVLKDKSQTLFINEREIDDISFSTKGGFIKMPKRRKPAFSKIQYNAYFYMMLTSLDEMNRIVDINSKHQNALTDSGLMEMFGCCRTVFDTFMAEARRLECIASFSIAKKKTYFVNPAYGYFGTKLSKELFLVFRENCLFLSSITYESAKNIKEKWDIDIFEIMSMLKNDNKNIVFNDSVNDEFITVLTKE